MDCLRSQGRKKKGNLGFSFQKQNYFLTLNSEFPTTALCTTGATTGQQKAKPSLDGHIN